MSNMEPSPEVVDLHINSVSNQAAKCDDIVLRETATTRVVFRAMLVNKDDKPAGARGQLIHQRRAKGEDWADCNTMPLTRLKAGEGVAILLKTAELASLRQWLNDLHFLNEQFGVPSKTRFVGVRKNSVAAKFGGDPVTVLVPKSGDGDEVAEAVAAVLGQTDLKAVVAALKDTPVDQLLALRQHLGLSALDHLLAEWDADDMVDDEEHWQGLLTRHSFALEQVFHAPSVVVDAKAYVGGKAVTNKGGNIVDFLLATASTGRAMLVEIKKPTTPLILGQKPYRNNAWNVDTEVAGATIQVLTYRDSLLEGMAGLDEAGDMLRRSPPQCAVIVGHSDSLDDLDKQRSFELARNRPDVVILTFDELRTKLEGIKTALKAAQPDDARAIASSTRTRGSAGRTDVNLAPDSMALRPELRHFYARSPRPEPTPDDTT